MVRLKTKKWLLMTSILAILLLALVGCSKDGEEKDFFDISGVVLDDQGVGLAGVTVSIKGSTNSQVTTDADGQWSATVSGPIVLRPIKDGYFFSPKELSIQEQTRGITFTLETLIREEGDPSIILDVEGLLLGEMYLYKVHVKEITGIKDAAGYSLLSKGDFTGVFKRWDETSYGASLSQQITLAIVNEDHRVLATVEVSYGTNQRTLEIIKVNKSIHLKIIESKGERLNLLTTHDYLGVGYVENRVYEEEDIPLSITGVGSLPPGYILINDIAVEFHYAFDDPEHFNDLLTEKYEEVDYIYDELHLYISLPDQDSLIDAKTGEELTEEEKAIVLSGILLLYDHDHPEGTPLSKANVSVMVLSVGPSTIYRVWVHSVEGVEGAESFTLLSPDNLATPFGEELARTTLEDTMPVYILDRDPEEPVYTISGIVENEEGEGISGVTISFTGGFDPVTTETDGSFSKDGLSGTVTVTPTKEGYMFDPFDEVVLEERHDVNFTGTFGFVEDFSEGFAPYWHFTGDADWVIDESTYTEAGQSAQSGSITHNQSSGLKIMVNVVDPGAIAFDRKVSSESNWDYLRFYVDGQQIASWSGERDWARMSYDLEPGLRELEWRYTKDPSVSRGQDCGWVDNITLTGLPLVYSVSGYVEDETGSGIEGVTIEFSGGYTPVTTLSNGSWSKAGLSGIVTVTPSHEGFMFDPLYEEVNEDRHDVNFVGLICDNTLTGTISIEHHWPTSVVDIRQTSSRLRTEETIQEIFAEEYVPGQIIVSFYPLISVEEKESLFKELQATVLDYLSPLNAYLLDVSEGREDIKIQRALESRSVVYAELNYTAQTYGTTIPDDPLYAAQWHYPQIRLPQAWNVTTGSPWVRVAVLDTGVNVNHPDLGTMVDTDSGYNFIDDNDDSNDFHGHGTHVAGTIGADTDNDLGVSGIMWEASIIPVKVLDDTGSGSFWGVAQGIYYAAGLLDNPSLSDPAHVINMSLGGSSSSSTMEQAVEAADDAGVIIVASSGNSGGSSIGYPARYPEVIAVGSVNYNYPNEPQRAWYSSYGPELDLVAPGGDTSQDSDGDGNPDGVLSTALSGGNFVYSYYQGTSMAAPHVSGVVGLMLAAGLEPYEVREVLHRTSMDLGSEGFDQFFGHGLINAYWAVNAVENINIVVGERQGDTFESVAEGHICLGDLSFYLINIPAGQHRVYAWIDVQGTGVIDGGDYLAESEPIIFEENGEYYVDLILTEIND